MTAASKTTSLAILVVGVLVGSLTTAALIHGSSAAEARVQAGPQLSAPARFQISTFAYGYGYGGGNHQSKWGVYVVDTQTGDLYYSVEGEQPHAIGRVGQK